MLRRSDPLAPENAARLKQFGAAALSTFETVCNSFLLACDVIERNVPGDLVECGVFAGTQVAAMAYACGLHGCGLERKLHLYDSFKGIPMAGPRDGAYAKLVGQGTGPIKSSGVSACSAAAVIAHMQQWGIDLDRLVFHEGWFQDTLLDARTRPRRIAILRLDGDLYDSTMVCLRYLYPLVSPGGYVIVDDYALEGCRAAVQDYFGAGWVPAVTPVEGGLGPVYWRAS